MAFTLNISFTDRAARLLPPGQTALRLAGISEDAQRSLALGDHIRIADIANCPWFVVSARYWEIGADIQLRLWLDEPSD
jgi:hypothetical protein